AGELRTMVTLSLEGPRGPDPVRFRGAGHRHGHTQQVYLGEDSATPGYLPGPVPAGEWTVTLHTHLVVDRTVGELSITGLTSAPRRDAPRPFRLAPAPIHGRWMMGDLHCHT